MPSEASTQTSSSSEDECPSTSSLEYSNSTRSSGEYESSSSSSESSSYESSSSRSSNSGSSSSRSSSSGSSGSSSDESSSSESSSEESSESDAAEFEAGRNEFLRRRLLQGMSSSPMAQGPVEVENPEVSWTMAEGSNDRVEEAASIGELDIDNLDISSIQDQYYVDLDESDLGFQQPSARGQAHLCETPETSYEFNHTV